jgi:predicted enzyme related to lactoylglutathione lyase
VKKMSDHMIKTNGAFSWFELPTTDVDGAKKFYSALLGWDFTSMGPEMGNYDVINLNGVGIGGIFPEEDKAQTPMWRNVISVDDVDASVEKAQQLGGKIIVPITDIPSVGRSCMIQDPQGAVFQLITYA